MNQRDMWIQLGAELSGRPVEDVAADFERFCAMYPGFREGLDRPMPPELIDKLREELPGIALWALEGLREQYQKGDYRKTNNRNQRPDGR